MCFNSGMAQTYFHMHCILAHTRVTYFVLNIYDTVHMLCQRTVSESVQLTVTVFNSSCHKAMLNYVRLLLVPLIVS